MVWYDDNGNPIFEQQHAHIENGDMHQELLRLDHKINTLYDRARTTIEDSVRVGDQIVEAVRTHDASIKEINDLILESIEADMNCLQQIVDTKEWVQSKCTDMQKDYQYAIGVNIAQCEASIKAFIESACLSSSFVQRYHDDRTKDAHEQQAIQHQLNDKASTQVVHEVSQCANASLSKVASVELKVNLMEVALSPLQVDVAKCLQQISKATTETKEQVKRTDGMFLELGELNARVDVLWKNVQGSSSQILQLEVAIDELNKKSSTACLEAFGHPLPETSINMLNELQKKLSELEGKLIGHQLSFMNRALWDELVAQVHSLDRSYRTLHKTVDEQHKEMLSTQKKPKDDRLEVLMTRLDEQEHKLKDHEKKLLAHSKLHQEKDQEIESLHKTVDAQSKQVLQLEKKVVDLEGRVALVEAKPSLASSSVNSLDNDKLDGWAQKIATLEDSIAAQADSVHKQLASLHTSNLDDMGKIDELVQSILEQVVSPDDLSHLAHKVEHLEELITGACQSTTNEGVKFNREPKMFAMHSDKSRGLSFLGNGSAHTHTHQWGCVVRKRKRARAQPPMTPIICLLQAKRKIFCPTTMCLLKKMPKLRWTPLWRHNRNLPRPKFVAYGVNLILGWS